MSNSYSDQNPWYCLVILKGPWIHATRWNLFWYTVNRLKLNK